jgi:hypothetical protein
MGDTHLVTLPDGRRLAYADHGDPAGPVILACVGTPQSRLIASADAGLARDMGFRPLSGQRHQVEDELWLEVHGWLPERAR